MNNDTQSNQTKQEELVGFTPGPWEIGEVEPPFEIVHTIPIRRRGATCWSIARVPDGQDDVDNARLIAAAPDLYAACETLLKDCKDSLNDMGDCDHAVNICVCGLRRNIEDAEAALMKARGAK